MSQTHDLKTWPEYFNAILDGRKREWTMTRQEILLIQLGEECAEVIQEISKCMRFGLDEVYAKEGISNIQRVVREMTDVRAIEEMLADEGLMDVGTREQYRNAVEAKKIKVEKLLEYSKVCGRLPVLSGSGSEAKR